MRDRGDRYGPMEWAQKCQQPQTLVKYDIRYSQSISEIEGHVMKSSFTS